MFQCSLISYTLLEGSLLTKTLAVKDITKYVTMCHVCAEVLLVSLKIYTSFTPESVNRYHSSARMGAFKLSFEHPIDKYGALFRDIT